MKASEVCLQTTTNLPITVIVKLQNAVLSLPSVQVYSIDVIPTGKVEPLDNPVRGNDKGDNVAIDPDTASLAVGVDQVTVVPFTLGVELVYAVILLEHPLTTGFTLSIHVIKK